MFFKGSMTDKRWARQLRTQSTHFRGALTEAVVCAKFGKALPLHVGQRSQMKRLCRIMRSKLQEAARMRTCRR